MAAREWSPTGVGKASAAVPWIAGAAACSSVVSETHFGTVIMSHRAFVVFSVLLSFSYVFPAAPASGRDIFVSNTSGDDQFNGLGLQSAPDGSGPVRTLARALRLAGPGDRIVLTKTDRPYRESISLVGTRHSGYPDRPLTIVGNGATLDGSEPVPPEAWEHDEGAVFRVSPPRKGQAQLFLDGRPAPRVVPAIEADRPPQLNPTQWCFLDGAIYFCVDQDKIPADYALTYARLPVGITLYHVERVAILDLTVQGFQLDGISAHNSARDVFLAGLTCRGNARAGISVGGASEVTIEGCLVGNNGEAQVLTLPYSLTRIRNCDLLGNTAAAWVDRGGEVWVDGKEVHGGADEIAPPGAAPEKPSGGMPENTTDSKP